MGKVSVYIDEKVWNRFKRKAIQKSGSMKSLSKEVSILVQDSLVEDAIIEGFKSMGYQLKELIPSGEVQAIVPQAPTSSGEIIREMRGRRIAKGLP